MLFFLKKKEKTLFLKLNKNVNKFTCHFDYEKN
jgi:hypothetical protein